MPDPIVKLMDQVAAGAGNTENASSIRERLKQIRDLFKFSRYRPTPDGKHTIEDSYANTGGNEHDGDAGSLQQGGKRKRNGGRAGTSTPCSPTSATRPQKRSAALPIHR